MVLVVSTAAMGAGWRGVDVTVSAPHQQVDSICKEEYIKAMKWCDQFRRTLFRTSRLVYGMFWRLLVAAHPSFLPPESAQPNKVATAIEDSQCLPVQCRRFRRWHDSTHLEWSDTPAFTQIWCTLLERARVVSMTEARRVRLQFRCWIPTKQHRLQTPDTGDAVFVAIKIIAIPRWACLCAFKLAVLRSR